MTMRTLTFVLFSLFIVMSLSCGNAGQDKEKLKEELKEEILTEMKNNENQENTEKETTKTNPLKREETTNPNAKTVVAQFQMMVANTAGTSYFFETSSGKEMQFFPDKNLKGMEFANSLRPGSNDHKYFGKSFELKYEKRNVETPGGRVDRLILLSAKDAKNVEKSESTIGALNASELKNIQFNGVEPNWTLIFKDAYAEYTEMGQNTKKIYYKRSYSDSSKPPLSDAIFSDSERKAELQGDFGDKSVKFTIRKENCSDGMSDNNYPYSIDIMFDKSGVLQGCGRIK